MGRTVGNLDRNCSIRFEIRTFNREKRSRVEPLIIKQNVSAVNIPNGGCRIYQQQLFLKLVSSLDVRRQYVHKSIHKQYTNIQHKHEFYAVAYLGGGEGDNPLLACI